MSDEISMPLHTTIVEYLDSNQEFKECLKVYNKNRFTPLQIIIITGIDEYPEDEIIGLFTLERSVARRNKRTFIQDYLVWHKNKGTFDHYTALESDEPNVHHIRKFWRKYGLKKYYGTTPEEPLNGDHWYKNVDELPDIIREEGSRVLWTYSKP